MTLHYQEFIEKMRNCPITVGYGPSGTGKTTALHSGLSLLGADGFRFFHHLSPAKALQLCSVTNIPLGRFYHQLAPERTTTLLSLIFPYVGLDDPDSKSNFAGLLIDLYHGAAKATMTSGEIKPISSMVVSSNFTPHENQRSEPFYTLCTRKQRCSRTIQIILNCAYWLVT